MRSMVGIRRSLSGPRLPTPRYEPSPRTDPCAREDWLYGCLRRTARRAWRAAPVVSPFAHSQQRASRRPRQEVSPHGRDLETDVVVIGAGIVGASCAHHLGAAGHRVTVLEARSGYAEGSSGRSFASVRSASGPTTCPSTCPGTASGPAAIRGRARHRRRLPADRLPAPRGRSVLGAPARGGGAPARARRTRGGAGPGGRPAVRHLRDRRASRVRRTAPQDGRIDPHIATGAYLELARGPGASVHFCSPVTAIENAADGSWHVRTATRTVRARPRRQRRRRVERGGRRPSPGSTSPVVHSRATSTPPRPAPSTATSR